MKKYTTKPNAFKSGHTLHDKASKKLAKALREMRRNPTKRNFQAIEA